MLIGAYNQCLSAQAHCSALYWECLLFAVPGSLSLSGAGGQNMQLTDLRHMVSQFQGFSTTSPRRMQPSKNIKIIGRSEEFKVDLSDRDN